MLMMSGMEVNLNNHVYNLDSCENKTSKKKVKPQRRGSFPFRKRSMPFSRHLEIFFLAVNKFFSTKLKKKENLQVTI